jgi:hypothetical protein
MLAHQFYPIVARCFSIIASPKFGRSYIVLTEIWSLRYLTEAQMSKKCRKFAVVLLFCDGRHIVVQIPSVMIQAVGQQGYS